MRSAACSLHQAHRKEITFMSFRSTLFLALTAALVLSACTAANTAATAAEGIRMGDAEIAHIARTANNGEIQEATAAQPKLQNAGVRALATMIINDHTAANARLDGLSGTTAAAFADNEVSRQLEANSRQAVQAINATPASVADRAFIQRQIAIHRYVVQQIDQTLLPRARGGELRSILTEMRTAVAAHLAEAERLAGTF
jgi:putative membrane protein